MGAHCAAAVTALVAVITGPGAQGSGRVPLSCNWGGASNADANADANGLAFPTECTSTDYSQLSPDPLDHHICGEFSRCLTAVVTVEEGFDDEVGLGCVSNLVMDDAIEDWLSDSGHFGPEAVQSVSNCSTPNCNPCGAAIDQPGWFWHTLAGKAAIGAALILVGFLGMWIFGCIRQRRCMGFWSLSQAYQASFRDSHSNSETHPLINEPVPPSYQEAASGGAGDGAGDGPGPYTEPASGGGSGGGEVAPTSSHYEDDLHHLQPLVALPDHQPAYPLAPPPAYLQVEPKDDL